MNASKLSKLPRIELVLQNLSVQFMETNGNLARFQSRMIDFMTQKSQPAGSLSELSSQTMSSMLAHSADKEILENLTSVSQGNESSPRSEIRGFEGEPIKQSSVTSIRISASLPQDGSGCRLWCSCACHTRRTLCTPPLFRNLLGQLFVGYTGIPLVERPCDQDSCQPHGSKKKIYPTFLCGSSLECYRCQSHQRR